jgi:hypothetical protein
MTPLARGNNTTPTPTATMQSHSFGGNSNEDDDDDQQWKDQVKSITSAKKNVLFGNLGNIPGLGGGGGRGGAENSLLQRHTAPPTMGSSFVPQMQPLGNDMGFGALTPSARNNTTATPSATIHGNSFGGNSNEDDDDGDDQQWKDQVKSITSAKKNVLFGNLGNIPSLGGEGGGGGGAENSLLQRHTAPPTMGFVPQMQPYGNDMESLSVPAPQLLNANMEIDVTDSVVTSQTSNSVVVQRQRARLLVEPPRPLDTSKNDLTPTKKNTSHTQRLLKKAQERRRLAQGGSTQPESARLRSDPNLFMRQSFRNGWGGGGIMTHVCRNKHTGKYEVKILRLRAVTGEPPLLPSDASTLQPQNGTFGNIRAQAPLLNVLLTAQQRERKHQEAKMNMSMDMDMDMDMDTKNDEEQRQRQNRKKHRQLLPNPSGARLIAMIHKYAQLHEAAAVSSPAERPRQVREASVWRLVSALWGSPSYPSEVINGKELPTTDAPALRDLYENVTPAHDTTPETLRTRFLRRRLAVVAWLRETMRETMRDSPATSTWDALTRLDVLGACNIAMEQKNFKLASLLSQSTGRETLCKAMAEQMRLWEQSGVLERIRGDLLRAYVLLSGKLDDEVLSSASVTWFQHFAMRLCYNEPTICTTSDAVARGLNSYRQAWNNSKAQPPHLIAEKTATQETDVRYLLLELACMDSRNSTVDVRECLKTCSMTTNPMDHALSWHLCQTMRSIGLQECQHKQWLTNDEEHWLTSNYATQLENAGMWHWAVYVANHLADEERRQHRIMSILYRNCPRLTDSTPEEQRAVQSFTMRVEFLKQEIGINPMYVHRARVLRARYDSPHFEPAAGEYADMAAGKLLNELHRDVFLHLLPQCMLEGKDDTLRKMLSILSQESMRDGGAVGEWDSSGDLVRTYLEVKQMLSPPTTAEEGAAFAAQLQQPEYLNRLRAGLDHLTRKLGGSTVQAGRLSLPEKAKAQHDTSGLVARARRKLTICEQQMVGIISRWRFVLNESAHEEAHYVIRKETGMIQGQFGALTLGLEAGSLVACLRQLLQKWLDAFA